MKKKSIKILMTSLVLYALASCNGTINDVTTNGDKSIDNLIRVENGTLVMENESVFDETKARLSAMSITERIAFFDSLGFKSQYCLMREADKELETLCNTIETVNEFKPLYEAYKQKYESVFMFNDFDSEDLSPYSKLKSPIDELFANENGMYKVGDRIVNSEMFDSFQDFYIEMNPVTLRSVEKSNEGTSTNHAWSHTNNRKVSFHVYKNGNVIEARFSAQCKKLLGWYRYDAEYTFVIHLYQGSFVFCAADEGMNILVNYLPTPPPPLPGSINPIQRTLQRKGGNIFYETFGIYSGTISGRMEVWSSGISYADRGIAPLSL